jgi:hypothetical protein
MLLDPKLIVSFVELVLLGNLMRVMASGSRKIVS